MGARELKSESVMLLILLENKKLGVSAPKKRFAFHNVFT